MDVTGLARHVGEDHRELGQHVLGWNGYLNSERTVLYSGAGCISENGALLVV
jgi:hypothetical protein